MSLTKDVYAPYEAVEIEYRFWALEPFPKGISVGIFNPQGNNREPIHGWSGEAQPTAIDTWDESHTLGISAPGETGNYEMRVYAIEYATDVHTANTEEATEETLVAVFPFTVSGEATASTPGTSQDAPSSDDSDTPQTDPASAFTIDASALEAADDPYEYMAAELDKVYSDVFGTAEVSDNPADNATTSFRIRFNAYEIGNLDNTDTYMPDIEKAESEIYAAFNEVPPYNVIGIRFYILEDSNPIGYIAPNYSESLLYTEDTYYEYKDGAWVEHRYSDNFVREEW